MMRIPCLRPGPAGMMLMAMLLAQPACADRYALLIGVGTYSAFPAFHLDGPAEDVPAVRDALIRTWKFPQANVRTLVDAEATKARILEALDALIGQVKDGDKVFLYYSGHGTSALDPRNSRIGLPLNSGALIPFDVRPAPPAGLLQQFIVGAIDLRPRLRVLDERATVFVVIDSCYSGAAVKSVADGLLSPRGLPVSLFARGGSLTNDDYDAAYTSVRMPPVNPDGYPYQRLVFLSAAAQSEKAYEASRAAIQMGVLNTVDAKPHGLLTDSLLRAFRGEADENHDGTITYEEVRRFALARVMDLGQTPQLLPRNAPAVTDQAIFDVAGAKLAVPPPTPERSGEVSITLSPGAQGLGSLLAGIPGVRLVQGQAADLAITRAGNSYQLYIGNGVRIHEYSDAEVPRLIERLRREPEIRILREWVYPKQAFHAALDVEPANRDAYALGEAVDFQLSADHLSYLLLLNIDVSGEVTVVYKSPPNQPAKAGETVPVATCINAPAGTEYMKLFAFAARPVEWESLPVSGFPADGPQFQKLMMWLRRASPQSAQASWQIYSTGSRRPERRCLQ
jgi:Caspase domain